MVSWFTFIFDSPIFFNLQRTIPEQIDNVGAKFARNTNIRRFIDYTKWKFINMSEQIYKQIILELIEIKFLFFNPY